MAKDSVSITPSACKLEGEEDFMLAGLRTLLQSVMEAEVEQHTGASLNEQSTERHNYRNGYRTRELITRLGNVLLEIPRVRYGSYMPSFLNAYKRTEKALFSVVQEAYVNGVSTRKMDALVKALGVEHLDKSAVSRITAELDEELEMFRSRPLECSYAYLWLDATYIKVRASGRVVSKAVVIAMAVREDGEREIVGLDIGPAESEAFWKSFLRSLCRRGLERVKLVISDAHEGLKKASSAVFAEASWQRCRVHFTRNALGQVAKQYQQLVAASIRQIFLQPDYDSAREQLREISDKLCDKFGKVSEMLDEAQEDLLAYSAFPTEHHSKIWSTNPLERLNKEVKRRTKAVGLFPNEKSALRLISAVLLEQNEQWTDEDKRYMSLKSMREMEVGESKRAPGRHIPDQAALSR
jgi:putative transposase